MSAVCETRWIFFYLNILLSVITRVFRQFQYFLKISFFCRQCKEHGEYSDINIFFETKLFCGYDDNNVSIRSEILIFLEYCMYVFCRQFVKHREYSSTKIFMSVITRMFRLFVIYVMLKRFLAMWWITRVFRQQFKFSFKMPWSLCQQCKVNREYFFI